jgi:hypothetical protein
MKEFEMTGKLEPSQAEDEFRKLMPVSGRVETFFGEFELDHGFSHPRNGRWHL